MNPQHPLLFKIVDDYVRAEHACFVSECFVNQLRTEWVICVRPTNESARTLDRYACKYFRLTLQEVEELCTFNAISSALSSRIDRELHSMTDAR